MDAIIIYLASGALYKNKDEPAVAINIFNFPAPRIKLVILNFLFLSRSGKAERESGAGKTSYFWCKITRLS